MHANSTIVVDTMSVGKIYRFRHKIFICGNDCPFEQERLTGTHELSSASESWQTSPSPAI